MSKLRYNRAFKKTLAAIFFGIVLFGSIVVFFVISQIQYTQLTSNMESIEATIFDIDYDSYNQSAKYISYLLTPATVSLAIPLYRQLDLLKQNFISIIIGILSGVLTSLVSILGMSMAFRLTHKEYITLLPKSITTAIGMGVSEELGGYITITIVVIIRI